MSRPRPFQKPKGSYTQPRRLLELYDRLHQGGILHASRLSEELGVAKRTIERDLAVLHEVLGSRIEWLDLPEPGWRWAARQRKWATSRWQVLAVAIGATMTGFLSGKRFHTHVKPLLEQLRGSLPQVVGYRTRTLEKKIHVVESGQKLYRDNPELQHRLQLILDGLLLDRAVELTYLSAKSQSEGRGPRPLRVHPLALVLHRASVYFIVDFLDPVTQQRTVRRLLALDRIPSARLDRNGEVLQVPRGFDAKTFLSSAFAIWTGERDHVVRIQVSAEYKMFVVERHWHHSERIEALPCGGVLLEMRLGELKEVAGWIVGMAQHAKVLGPPELAAIVRDRLEQARAQYE